MDSSMPHSTAHANHVARLKNSQAALDAVVDECFSAFHMETHPRETLDVCTLCCARPELEDEIRRSKQRHLNVDQVYEYIGGARTVEEPPSQAWSQYFLPRIVEIYAHGRELPSADPHFGLGMAGLERLRALNWKTELLPLQREALNRFAFAWLENRLAHYPWEQPDKGPFTALVILINGDFDLQPLLNNWLNNDSPSATLNFIDSWNYEYFCAGQVHNPFLSDTPAAVRQLHDWIRNSTVRATFRKRISQLDPHLLEVYRAKVHRWIFLADIHPDEYVLDFLTTNKDLAPDYQPDMQLSWT